MMLLPPAESRCCICATAHRDDDPHNAASLYYQYRFRANHGRWPTWADAIAHCTPRVRSSWKQALLSSWTEPPAGQDPIADPPHESLRRIVLFGDDPQDKRVIQIAE